MKITDFKPDERTQLHIKWGGIVFSLVSGALLSLTDLDPNLSLDIGFTAGAIAAVGKECWDKWVKPRYTLLPPKFDPWDMIVTIAAVGIVRCFAGQLYQLVTFLKTII